MIKRTLFLGVLATLALSSCVSLSEHESLQTKYDQTAKQYKLTRQELDEIKEENAALTRQNTGTPHPHHDSALKERHHAGVFRQALWQQEPENLRLRHYLYFPDSLHRQPV